MSQFDPARLLSLPVRVTNHALTDRDTIIYALGVGAGQDGDARDLHYVYGPELRALPTMAAVMAYPGFWQRERDYGIDWQRVLHAEQSITWHRPLPSHGSFRGEMKIEWIVDKGAEKGALLCSRREVFDDQDGALIATVRQTSFLRGDGGRGGSSDTAPQPHAVPAREPDERITLGTRAEQALIYRLSGDYNPLHVDPAVATAAGLPRPILHGLCTYGVAGRALVAGLCDHQAERMKRMDCRFTAPVFPGETIVTSIWREGAGRAAFQAHVAERDTLVLGNGYVEFEER